MSKRVFDVVAAALGLLLAAPVLALLSPLIKLDSPGPVLFRQRRVGKDGRLFWILKFRTMVQGADRLGPRLTQRRDPRITRVGALLRWLKLDELPQLVNVIRGDMSLVGPRPEDPYFVGLYSEEQRRVLAVRPGLVGPSQILGRDELEKYPDGVVDTERYYIEHILPEKLATDLAYARSYGLGSDLRFIGGALLATVFGAFKGRFLRLNRARIALLTLDTAASLAVYQVAYGIKFEWTYAADAWPFIAVVSALIAAVRPPVFVYFGLYQPIVRYLAIKDFVAIGKAVTVGSVLIVAATFMMGFQAHSRFVFLVDGGLLTLVLFGIRIGAKSWLEYSRPRPHDRRHVVVVGADDVGAQLVTAMVEHDGGGLLPVGLLDDDPRRHGTTIRGVPVVGRLTDLPLVAPVKRVELVVIAAPQLASPSVSQLIAQCRALKIEYRVVPALNRLLRGDDISIPEVNGAAAGSAAHAAPDTPAAARPLAHEGGPGGGRPGAGTVPRAAGEASPLPEDGLVLVTGGAGYVGSHLVTKLLERGRRVRVVDNFLYGRHGLRELCGHPRLEIIEGDIRHLRTMTVAVRGVQAVVALAALVGDAACDLDEDETISTNLGATDLLADLCEGAGVRRVVFASSCSVYGANSELMLNEGSWLQPVSLYARTRILSEESLLRRRERLGVTVLRLATVFGLSRRMRLDLVVNTFTAQASFTREIRVFGGSQWRPNVHVQDAAEAFVLALGADDAKVRGEIFNVGDDRLNHTVLDIAQRVGTEIPGSRIVVADATADGRDYRVSCAKIRHLLGFQPRFTVADGVREIAVAISRGAIAAPDDVRYHNGRFLQRYGFRRPSTADAAVSVA